MTKKITSRERYFVVAQVLYEEDKCSSLERALDRISYLMEEDGVEFEDIALIRGEEIPLEEKHTVVVSEE